MAGDDLRAFRTAAEVFDGLLGHIAVRCAVEAVAADFILSVQLVGNRVEVRLLGHRAVEGGVDDQHLRGGRQDLHTAADAQQMRDRVQRRDVAALFQVGKHLLADEHRLGQPFAAVDDTVADGADLVHIGQASVLLVQQTVNERLRRLRVGGHGDVGGIIGLAGGVVGDFAVDADPLTDTLGDDLVLVHIKKLILQRRASRVDYEYIHNKNKHPFFCA